MYHLDKTLNWGIIGCGNVTEVKSGPAYNLTEGFKIAAVMRRDVAKAKDYAQRHSIDKVYDSADALINDNAIDAIYIATPPDTHKFYGLKVAEAGKICCIEKPMAPSYKDSLEIYNAFKKKGLPLFIAYYRRSLPRFHKVKEWLDNKVIGDLRHISWALIKPASDLDKSKAYNWRTDSKIATGGYFDDLASHGLNLFTFLLGDIKDVHGFGLNQQQLYTANDAITACWIHKNGITGAGNWHFGCDQHYDNVQIYGSEGSIQFSVFHEKPIILNNADRNEELLIENPKHIQLHHVQGMKDMLINNNIHPSMGDSALHTSWVMDKILGKL